MLCLVLEIYPLPAAQVFCYCLSGRLTSLYSCNLHFPYSSEFILSPDSWSSGKWTHLFVSSRPSSGFSPSMHRQSWSPPLSLSGMLAFFPHLSFLPSSVGKESACSAGDPGSIPGLRRSPGEGNGNPLQYPSLENLMGRGPWRAGVHGVSKTQTWLSD